MAEERYTKLWVDTPSRVFLGHDEAEHRHPLARTRT
jgi:hypothetical protein